MVRLPPGLLAGLLFTAVLVCAGTLKMVAIHKHRDKWLIVYNLRRLKANRSVFSFKGARSGSEWVSQVTEAMTFGDEATAKVYLQDHKQEIESATIQ